LEVWLSSRPISCIRRWSRHWNRRSRRWSRHPWRMHPRPRQGTGTSTTFTGPAIDELPERRPEIEGELVGLDAVPGRAAIDVDAEVARVQELVLEFEVQELVEVRANGGRDVEVPAVECL